MINERGQGDNVPLRGGGGRATAVLAYLGDAVFELLVRDMLVRENVPFKDIFRRAKGFVSAKAQSEMYHRIFPQLSPEEQAILKRGRNLHNLSRAKSANVTEYRHATGLETLFGHLHKNGEFSRLNEIFLMCVKPQQSGDTL
ncbi:MAG: Mini-ribonuclease 3 [Defluviitaleaceae bacterium]|nr:Mini-ribonuclease 3 [Defluviitaleaceae bacterium]MCL2262999.1 Mini-ribonuclease 3 [Defluviitaleaceae bacterium]